MQTVRVALEVAVGPSEGPEYGLGGVAATGRLGREYPADLRVVAERRTHGAPRVGKADIGEVAPRSLLLDRPIAVSHHGPMAGIAEEARPGFLLPERSGRDKARHLRIGPERRTGRKVLDPVAAEDEPLGFENRNGGTADHR